VGGGAMILAGLLTLRVQDDTDPVLVNRSIRNAVP